MIANLFISHLKFSGCNCSDTSVCFAGFIGNVPVMLAKPQTFMNLSGESVSDLI